MTDSTQVLKPDLTERVVRTFSVILAGAILVGAGWFGHASWTQNALQERLTQLEVHEAELDAYEIELQQWAVQAANTEFAAKRQALINELYNQTCVVPPGTFHLGNAAMLQFGSERLGVLIDGTCYVPTSSGYSVENQVKAQIPTPPEP